ncbi:MAG: hypothetical protein ACPL7O_05320 [Armatimonadota bacterium]
MATMTCSLTVKQYRDLIFEKGWSMAVHDLDARLELLDSLIDPQHVRCAEKLQESAFSYEEIDRLPVINPAIVDGWETFPYSEAFQDPEKMLVNELASVYMGTKLKDDRVYTIRATIRARVTGSP